MSNSDDQQAVPEDNKRTSATHRRLSRRRLAGRLIVSGGALVMGRAEGAASTRPQQSATGSGTLFSVADFGAHLDGTNDDSGALTLALQACDAAGGGTVLIPGRLALRMPVNARMANTSGLILRGLGSASQLIVLTGPSTSALVLGALETVAVEHLYFLGGSAGVVSAGRALDINLCIQAVLSDCHFYGLACETSVLDVRNAALRLRGCSFNGCGAAPGAALISMENWHQFAGIDCRLAREGNLDGGTFTTPPGNVPAYGLRLGANQPAVLPHVQAQVRLEGFVMDRAALTGVSVDPGADVAHPHGIRADGVTVNCAPGVDSPGIELGNVRNVHATQVLIQSPGGTGMRLRSAGNVTLSGVTCEECDIAADSGTRSLWLQDCEYRSLLSSAGVTRVEKAGGLSAPAMTSAARDAVTGAAPGALIYNLDSGRLNVWNGSGWSEV